MFQSPDMQRAGGGFASDMTQADLGSAMGGLVKSSGLMVGFDVISVKVENDGEPERHEQRLVVIKQPRGDRRAQVREMISEEQAMRQFPQEFSAFKQFGSVPTHGTPIEEMPSVSRMDILRAEALGVRSVEDLLQLSRDMAQQNGRDFLRMWEVAKAFKERNDGGKEVTDMVEAKMAAETRATTAEEKAMKAEAENVALKAQLEALKSVGLGAQTAVASPAPTGAVPIGSPVGEADAEDLPLMFDDGPNDGTIGESLDAEIDPILGDDG